MSGLGFGLGYGDSVRAQTNTLYANIPIYYILLASKLSYQMKK